MFLKKRRIGFRNKHQREAENTGNGNHQAAGFASRQSSLNRSQQRDLGEGMSMTSETVSNGMGGTKVVNVVLYDSATRESYQIVDEKGGICNFPGVENEEKVCEVAECGGIFPYVLYTFIIYKFENGEAEINWLFQPDGRYWEDEYGFGGNSDDEVELCARIDRKGRYLCKYHL